MIIFRKKSDSIKIISEYLIDGKICILPCDTIYGIVGLFPETENRIRDIKGRNENKPFIILSGPEAAGNIFKDEIPDEIKNYWPGPLTLISYDRNGSTTALRVPDDNFLLEILDIVGKPVFSTSVNFSGHDAINDIGTIKKQFHDKVDLICEAEEFVPGKASTIIDICKKPYRILRQGACIIPPEILKP